MTGRGLRGRETAQLMLVVGFAAVVVTAFLITAAPSSMGGESPNPLASWTTWLGAIGIIVGFSSMIRIYRADPEGHRSWWRFEGR
jgi:hypothetical protein